ncbi:hypothetical protein RB195_003638 [Necator americanus]|uniref:Amino acid transporter transmembrane domain-containing protein n=1 Tax=Necator americanus TaxID=51031 RepID=A0ABR1DPH6_NECAM
MPHVSVVDFTLEKDDPKKVPYNDKEKQNEQKESKKKEEKKISAHLTIINFLKGMIGPGCFSLPLAFREAGLWTGFALVFIVGLLSTICMSKLVKCSQFLTSRQPKVQSLNYAEMADESFRQSFPFLRNYGHMARRFVNLCLSSLVLGICSIYYIFVVDHTREVLASIWPQFQISKFSYLVIAIVPFILLSYVRSIRVMSYISLAGNVFMALSIILIFSQLLPAEHLTAELPWFTSFRRVVLATGAVIYSFEGQALILPLENRMKHPSEMRGWTGVLSTGMALVTITYVACGFFGYITYGENVKESITLNMDDGILNITMKIFLALVVYSGYLLQLYTLTETFHPSLVRFAEGRTMDTAKLTLILDYVLRTAIVLVSFVVAVLIPNLADLMPLIGVTAGMFLALIIPPTVDVTTFLPIYLKEKRYYESIIMGKMGQAALTFSSPSQNNANLDLLRRIDSLLTFYFLNENEKLFNDITKHIHSERFIGCFVDVTNNTKYSSTDLILVGQVFDKIARFVASGRPSNHRFNLKSGLASKWVDLVRFFKGLSSEEVKQFGAHLWLSSSKLFLSSSDFKLLSNEWNDIFLPMEHWFSSLDGDVVEVCLNKWIDLIAFVGSKSTPGGRNKLNKLIPMFCKPLRSRTMINKLRSAKPIINGYLALIKAFKDVLDEHFEELIICFLRFLAGRAAVVITATEDIQDKLKRSIHLKSTDLVLTCSPPSHLDYLLDGRPYRAFEESASHILPLICSLLGVAHNDGDKELVECVPVCGKNPLLIQKYTIFLGQMIRLAGIVDEKQLHTICSCFAVLAERIGCIEETAVKQSQSKLLFLQIKAWIDENYYNMKELESALCQLFKPKDLSMNAYTADDWPGMKILEAVLENSADGEISKLIEVVAETIHALFESPCIILRRADELTDLINEHPNRFETVSLLKAWAHLASIVKDYVRETDDINEGNIIEPDYPTTFGVLRLVFKIANRVNDEVDPGLIEKCCSAFELLYAEAQTTIRHEFGGGADMVLRGIFEDLIPPESLCCCNIYVSALTSIVDVYPFKLFNQNGLFSGSSLEFNALGEISGLVDPLKVVAKKLIELVDSTEGKLPRSTQDSLLAIANVCERIFKEVARPDVVRNLFVALSDLLKDMYPKFFGDDVRFKEVSQAALKSYLSILELVKTKVAGPFDDSLLAGCEPFLARLLGGLSGKRSKLRVSAAELWNKTFAGSKSLTYSKEFRKVLTTLVQKRVIYAPGLSRKSLSSSDINEYRELESPSDSATNSRSGRNVKDKVNGEVQKDEDSTCGDSINTNSSRGGRRRTKRSPVDTSADGGTPKKKSAREDIVFPEEEKPLKTLPPSPFIKKSSEQGLRSTPTRDSTPRTKRRNFVGLLEEDSVDYVPIAPSESAKKMKLTDRQKEIFSEKRDRMPFLDEDSQQLAVIKNIEKTFDLDSSQSTSLDTAFPASLAEVKEESTKRKVSNSQEVEQIMICEPVLVQENTVDIAADSDSSAGASSRRKTKIKLDFDKADTSESNPNDNEFPSDDGATGDSSESVEEMSDCPVSIKMVEPNLESEDSIGSSGEASAELSAESETDVGKKEENPLRSRRTQKKGTPTKYVARKRRSLLKSAEKEKPRRMSRGSKVRLSTVEDATQTVDELEKLGDVAEVRCAVNHEEDMLPLREIGEVLTTLEPMNLDEELCGQNKAYEADESPEKVTGDSEKVASAVTPSVIQRITGTPGILKKANSPSTAEKKLRRVHFDNGFENTTEDFASKTLGDVIKTSAEEQFPSSPKSVLKVVTPRRPFAHLQMAKDKISLTSPVVPQSDNNGTSPVKSEADLDDQPLFPELMECQESIVKVVGKLLPISTTTGSITLRKTLEARGILQIRHLAAMTRREISALNIKKPRVETTLKALSQFARDRAPTPKITVIKEAVVPETEAARPEGEAAPPEAEVAVPEGEIAAVPLEKSEAIAMNQDAERNAAIDNADNSDDGRSENFDVLEEAVATAEEDEAAVVSPTKEAAEPEEMSCSSDLSPDHIHPDPLSTYAEKLRLWRETVLEANRELEAALRTAEQSGVNLEDLRSKRGLLMMVSGCVEMFNVSRAS